MATALSRLNFAQKNFLGQISPLKKQLICLATFVHSGIGILSDLISSSLQKWFA